MDIETSEADEHRAEEGLEVQAEEQGGSFLFDIRVPVFKYVARMWLVGFVPSVVIGIVLAGTGVISEESCPDLGGDLHPVFLLFGIIVFSPVVETLAMGLVLKVLSFITKRKYSLAVASCIIWAGVHSLVSPAWGLGVVWPFFIFSCAYLAWRRRSWWRAMWVTCLIHVLQNFLPGILLFVDAIQKKGW